MSSGRDLLGSLNRLLKSTFWVLVAAVVLLLVVNGFLRHDRGRDEARERSILRDTPPPIPWGEVSDAVAEALEESRRIAQEAAAPEIEAWVASMKTRVDRDFLEWYFGYWNQQKMGLGAIWYWSQHQIFSAKCSGP